jgi:TolB-like protein
MIAPGTRLGPYEIVAPLGAGGMGEVWRARDARLGRDVAIKALPAAFAADPERLARFRREAQALAALNHPNVATLYGLEEGAGAPLLVLELVAGETLAARLARGPLSVPAALALCTQVASAIEAAHDRGIVHRDLKPGNVMVSDSGIAKVLDFGLARTEPAADPGDGGATVTAVAAATEAGIVLGTAAYMSPEQARGHVVDRRGDVWAFGCVLFECLAGRPPFEGATVTDLLARILERDPDWSAIPAGTPARVTDLLRRCLRKPADERPRDIRDVRLELLECTAAPAREARDSERAIAVLPFENQGGADDEYFADGVTDEILNALAQLEGLRVAARSSCFAFKGRREDPRAVGSRLGVSTVLEGSVRRAGTRLRITVQMVNVANGWQLWSERYDRDAADVFAVQDEIAAAVAQRLRVELRAGAGARRGTANLEAYELLLKGRAFQLRRGRFLADATACFEQALQLDPAYAEAMAGLADAWRLMATFGVAPPHESMPRARDMAERALAIDPGIAEAWATIADVEGQYRWDPTRSAAAWQRALALDPRHVRARCEFALWGQTLGSHSIEHAIAETETALAHEPLNPWVMGMRAFALGLGGFHDDAIAFSERSHAADPESVFGHWVLVSTCGWAGQHERALALARRLLNASGRHVWILGPMGWVLGRLGRAAESRAVFDELAARARHESLSPGMVAAAACGAGDADAAAEWARRAVEARDPLSLHLFQMPFFELLRGDPRWPALRAQLPGG